MSVSRRLTWHWMTALALALIGLLPATGAQAADQATTIIQVESPTSGTPASTRLMVTGWAADPSGDGAGVDAVRMYLGDPNADGQDLGLATSGQPRPDVANTLGDSRFTNSGFQLAIELPAGDYTLTIYAHRNTAGPDDGWVIYTTSFTASASVRPDPRAVAVLGGGGDQPAARSGGPSNNGAIMMGGGNGRTPTGDIPFSASSPDGSQIRTSVTNRNDPIPLDPIIPGATSSYSPGRNDPEIADATGSGSNIRISVASDNQGGSNNGNQYRTGSVSINGGQANSCPGPNCPANSQNMNQQLQNMPSDMLRQLTGYNIPGFGNNVPCIPTNQAGATNACNPATGSSQAPGAPTGIQQLQAQTAAAQQAANNQPVFSPAGGTTPQCMLAGANGQCSNPAGSVGPLGSTCLRFAGQQCAYYGQAPTPAAGAPGQTPNGAAARPGQGAPAGTTPQQLAGLTSGGCAQWGGAGQCLQLSGAGNSALQSTAAGLAGNTGGSAANLMQQQASVPLTSTGQSSLYQTSATGAGQSSLYQTSMTGAGQSSIYPASTTGNDPYSISQAALTGSGQSSLYQTSTTGVAGATASGSSPYGSMPLPGATGSSGGGVCLQFGVGGACVRSQ